MNEDKYGFTYTPLKDQGLSSLWSNSNIQSANNAGNNIANMVTGYDSSGNAIFADGVTAADYNNALNSYNTSLANTAATDSTAFNNTGLADLFSGSTSSDGGGLFGLSNSTIGNMGTLYNIGSGLYNLYNSNQQLKLAQEAYDDESDRADELLAMQKDQYNTYKADKARLNSEYA